ncbi:hypothetical protein RM405_000497 [Enterobacter kobei]|uniref:hypothetical protein n=1 Tax=Enterobacter kobei TaxID=208224 RepID=UPI002875DEE3|nr:hypothetical protein [Enterobacter kobei]
MNDELRELARAVIEKYHLASLDDILREVPKTMCHVLQESDVFETWPADIVRLKFPDEHWDYYISRYEHFRDEVIRNLTPQDYLREMLGQTQRLPCFCSEMADVSAILYSQIINKPVYSLRNIFVNYLYLPRPWHCINAVVEDDRIRYFDISAYAQVLDRKRRKVVKPAELEGFDATDIAFDFIESPRWLQKEPYQRKIELTAGEIKDNFSPSPLEDKPSNEFLRAFH